MADTLAYADFDYYVSSAEVQAIQDLSAPLVGGGSLRVRRVSGTATCTLNFAPKTPDFPQGLIRGRLRVLTDQVVQVGVSQGYGLVVMQSQRDVTTGGAAYAVRCRDNDIELVKLTSGFDGGETTLATVADVLGSGLNAIQLEWAYSTDLGGTILLVSHGVLADFSDLTQVLAYQDLTSPLSTSVTEGGFYDDGGSGADFDIRFDQMRLEGP